MAVSSREWGLSGFYEGNIVDISWKGKALYNQEVRAKLFFRVSVYVSSKTGLGSPSTRPPLISVSTYLINLNRFISSTDQPVSFINAFNNPGP